MNAQPPDDHCDRSSAEPAAGVGPRLRAARLEQGIDLKHVAAELHIGPGLVEALEAGRYEELSAPVFVSGYIRGYARLVGLDPFPLLTAYRSEQGATEAMHPWQQVAAIRQDDNGRRPLVRLMTVAVVLGLGLLFFQWWQNRAPLVSDPIGEPVASALAVEPAGPGLGGFDRLPDNSAPAAGETPEAADPAPLPDSAAEPGTRGHLIAAAAADARADAVPVAVSTSDQSSAARQTATETAAAMDSGDVVLEFRGPCWVDVRDADKSFALTGEMGNGDRRVLGGTPPYSLILGNAAAVTVTVKGARIDLTRLAKGNVARFKLDPDQLP
jgi:cytoskeleton protein RodZ